MPIMRKMNLINVHFWTYLKVNLSPFSNNLRRNSYVIMTCNAEQLDRLSDYRIFHHNHKLLPILPVNHNILPLVLILSHIDPQFRGLVAPYYEIHNICMSNLH